MSRKQIIITIGILFIIAGVLVIVLLKDNEYKHMIGGGSIGGGIGLLSVVFRNKK